MRYCHFRQLGTFSRLLVGASVLGLGVAGGCKDDHAGTHGSRFEALSVIGGPGSTPGTFTIPRAIATDGRFLYVVDKSARIQKLDPDSGKCLAWWRTPISELGKPTGLTIAPAPPPVVRGNARVPGLAAGTNVLYVADTHYNRVLIYPLAPEGDDGAAGKSGSSGSGSSGSGSSGSGSSGSGSSGSGSSGSGSSKPDSGIPGGGQGGGPAAIASLDFTGGGPAESHPPILAQFGGYGTDPGRFIYITDVAVLLAADGKTVERLYTTEYGGNDRMQCFDGEFTPMWQVGSMGASETAEKIEMDRPQVVEIDMAKRELLLTDTRNHRIGRFTLDGALVKWFGSPAITGPADGGFRYPWSIYQMGDGTALVVEFGNNRISRVDLENGAILETMGEPGRLTGQFASPWTICGIGDRLFVVDLGNNRVQSLKRPPNRAMVDASEKDGRNLGAKGRGPRAAGAQSATEESQERIMQSVGG